MSFANPHMLWLLLVIPPGMILFFWWSARTRQKLMTQFIHARLLPGLIAGISTSREKIRAAALVAAAVFLILALARPQWGYDLQEVKQRGLDIVVAIDTSKSMLAEDIAPNRLARAKYAALDLMQQAKSDRLGLIAFAGTAFLQCPLTIDDSAFRQSVESLNVNTLPQGGTALAEAIENATKAFKEGDSYKVLVLFTDGEDQDSGAVEAAKKASKEGLRIFTIGIGSAEGELLRIKAPNGQSDYVRDENGNVVKSHLNENLLQEIAGAANGFYLPMRGANTIDTLYQKGLAPLPKSESQEKWVRQALDRYQWPLTAALVLLMAEIFFPERKRESRRANSLTKPLAQKVALALLLLVPFGAWSSPSSALREYRSGKYDAAQKDFEQSLQKQNDDPRLHFNAGAAAYRNQQFEQAAKHFNQALSSTDLSLQQQAYYNLGNTLFHEGERNPDPTKRSETWEDSVKKFESSLKLNPQDSDAKFNLEFVKKQLEELKQQQQKKDSKDSNKDQDKKDQNQQDESKQDQQKDQSKQQNSDQQKQSPQNQKQDQQQSEKDQKQQQQTKESPDKKNQKPEQANKSDQQKKDQESGEQKEAQAQSAPGQMTPEQAKQLLDAQKGDEMLLPVRPEQKASAASKPLKDW